MCVFVRMLKISVGLPRPDDRREAIGAGVGGGSRDSSKVTGNQSKGKRR